MPKNKQSSGFIKLIKNKYFYVTIIFLAIFLFVSNNNLFFTLGLKHEVNKLHDQESEIQQQIKDDSIFFQGLKGNPEAIERFGREQYLMSRDDEDLFVITSSEEE